MRALRKALVRVRKGYTPKELFKLKLTGKAVNVLRKTLARELDGWLVECDIFEPVEYGTSDYTYRCIYPVCIWYVSGKGAHELIKVDSMKPGDIWGF